MTYGKIIVLNGTSSSGKTSIVGALQHILDEPFLDAGIDKFLWMLPRRYFNPPLWNEVLGLATRAGPLGHQLISGMHHATAALSRTGNNVIVDHVLVEQQWLRDCAALFGVLPAWFVGVRCPLDVVEQREKERRNRTLGQAKAQYHLVHADAVYDLEVNTATSSPEECALQIRKHLEDGVPPSAFKRLNQRDVTNKASIRINENGT